MSLNLVTFFLLIYLGFYLICFSSSTILPWLLTTVFLLDHDIHCFFCYKRFRFVERVKSRIILKIYKCLKQPNRSLVVFHKNVLNLIFSGKKQELVKVNWRCHLIVGVSFFFQNTMVIEKCI